LKAYRNQETPYEISQHQIIATAVVLGTLCPLASVSQRTSNLPGSILRHRATARLELPEWQAHEKRLETGTAT
jgi:hypothetical protein